MTTSDAMLPVVEALEAIFQLVRENEVVILVGETGSGKTTRIPPALVYGHCLASASIPAVGHACAKCVAPPIASSSSSKMARVGITQPRRVAAITISRHVDALLQVAGGRPGEAAYSVRFDDTTKPWTQVKYMTDGILLREFLQDPMLSRYDALILDEAHERTLHGDLCAGLVKQLVRCRRDAASSNGLRPLKVMVMSATLDVQKFISYWDTFKVGAGYVSGRQFSVDVHYLTAPVRNYVEACVTSVLQIILNEAERMEPVSGENEPHAADPPNNILVFLTGRSDIETAYAMLRQKLAALPGSLREQTTLAFEPYKLYAALPPEVQERVFQPNGVRKVILSTNIAETSLTIPNVRHVIDSGLVKEKRFYTGAGLERLQTVPVSQAQATQRCGRAGRERAGTCYRLYTEDAFYSLAPLTTPEIQRCSTTFVVLMLKSLGVENVVAFDFIDAPPVASLKDALEELYILNALDCSGNITRIGRLMVSLPLDPSPARCLVAAMEFAREDVLDDMCTILAMLSVDTIFRLEGGGDEAATDVAGGKEGSSPTTSRSKRDPFYSPYGDFFVYLNVAQEYQTQWRTNREKCHDWCKRCGICPRNIKKAMEIRSQLKSLCRSQGGAQEQAAGVDTSACGKYAEEERSVLIRRCLCTGYYANVAVWHEASRSYRTLHSGQPVYLHPSSVLFYERKRIAPVVLYANLIETSRQYIRDVCVVSELLVAESAPRRYKAAPPP